MLTRDDIIDIIIAGLPKGRPAIDVGRGPAGRPFLSDHDIRKRLTPGATRLTLPKAAILSPLASEWLTLRGIEVIRE